MHSEFKRWMQHKKDRHIVTHTHTYRERERGREKTSRDTAAMARRSLQMLRLKMPVVVIR